MGNSMNVHSNNALQLSDFQKRKLLHEFHTFYDLNKDGIIEWKDFSMAKDNICMLNGWVPGSKKHQETSALFKDIWTSLCRSADRYQDDQITADEWISMWQQFHKLCCRRETQELPSWLSNYMQYRFNMYDRTGDGVIDCEEFVYVVTRLGIPEKDARQAYLIFTETNTKDVDFEYFSKLVGEYYMSNDPASLGNFITGKLNI
uniref:EF-hand domain-containing protein n=1 Tax=Strigamia maritima TaxID=126957 RepID=T1IJW5_STRMM